MSKASAAARDNLAGEGEWLAGWLLPPFTLFHWQISIAERSKGDGKRPRRRRNGVREGEVKGREEEGNEKKINEKEERKELYS